MIRFGLPLLLALIIPLAAHLGLTQALGAHPWWDQQVAWIGLPIGLLLAFAANRIQPLIALLLLAATTRFGLGLAEYGKDRFAASFGDDALAGQMWYAGWIVTTACAVATLAFLGWLLARMTTPDVKSETSR